jgi:hypothetical protein
MKNIISIIIISFVLGFLLSMCVSTQEDKEEVVTTTVTTYDTVTITKVVPMKEVETLPTPKIKPKPRDLVIAQLKVASDSIYVEDIGGQVNQFVYDSTVYLDDNLEINYRIIALGLVTSVEFGYTHNYEQINTTNTITNTITTTKQPTGFYGGMFGRSYNTLQSTVGAKVSIVRHKWAVSGSVGVDGSKEVGLMMRIF